MNTASGSSLVLRTAVVIALFGAAPLASAADERGSLALEEIVVTATKIAQDTDSWAPAAFARSATSRWPCRTFQWATSSA
jgi:outer membrane cobalamin receptor